jgi:hypothetical protein
LIEENPNRNTSADQISIFFGTNLEFNASQKSTNAPLARVTLKGKWLLDYINGNKIRPIFEAESQEEWEMIDSQVITLITNSLEPQLSEEFFYCEIAGELWQEI